MSVNMKAQTLIVNCEAALIPCRHSAGRRINRTTPGDLKTTHPDTEQHGSRETRGLNVVVMVRHGLLDSSYYSKKTGKK